MKVSIVKCKDCGHVIAGCNVDKGYPASWYKSIGKYISTGKWEVIEINSDGYIFDKLSCINCI